MADLIDDIDRALIRELQQNADRTNVELARVVGLSPAATLHRVRRLKDDGIIAGVHARVDPAAAGFPIQVHVEVTLGAVKTLISRVGVGTEMPALAMTMSKRPSCATPSSTAALSAS